MPNFLDGCWDLLVRQHTRARTDIRHVVGVKVPWPLGHRSAQIIATIISHSRTKITSSPPGPTNRVRARFLQLRILRRTAIDATVENQALVDIRR